MKLFRNLFTIAQGSVNEAGEFIVKKNSVRLIEQKLRNLEGSFQEGESALCNLAADIKAQQREIESINSKLKEYEGYIKQCLDSGKQQLAEEVAEKILGMENEKEIRLVQLSYLEKAESTLNKKQQQVHRSLDGLKRQLSLIKAHKSITSSMRMANQVINIEGDSMNSDLGSLLHSLEKSQQRDLDVLEAEESRRKSNTMDDLEQKLEAAKIAASGKKSVSDILNRYR